VKEGSGGAHEDQNGGVNCRIEGSPSHPVRGGRRCLLASAAGMPGDSQACYRKGKKGPSIRGLGNRPRSWRLAVAIPLQQTVIGRARPAGDCCESHGTKRCQENEHRKFEFSVGPVLQPCSSATRERRLLCRRCCQPP
jgi:hypothetical protein